MNDRDRANIQGFLTNYQTFFDDLCGALGVEHPPRSYVERLVRSVVMEHEWR
jgi:hypothetical protein